MQLAAFGNGLRAGWLPMEGLNMERKDEITEGRSTGNVEERYC
jgi:hypothetical protein